MEATITDNKQLRNIGLILKKAMVRRPGFDRVLIKTGTGCVEFIASTDKTTKILRADAEVSEPGAASIKIKRFNKLSNSLKKLGGQVTIKYDPEEPGTLHFDHEKLRTQLEAEEGEYFVNYYKADLFAGKPGAELDAEDFYRAMDNCFKSMSSDQSRENLCGLYIEDGECVSTDSQRLRSAQFDGFGSDGCTIPRRLVKMVRYAYKKYKPETIAAQEIDDFVAFGVAGHTFIGRKVGGTFPGWRNVIPERKDCTTIRVPVEDLVQAVGLLKPSTPNSDAVWFEAEDEEVMLVTEEGGGRTEAPLGGEVNREELKQTPVNIKYLKDMAKTLEDDEVEIDLHGKLTPMVFSEDSFPEEVGIIMPLRSW